MRKSVTRKENRNDRFYTGYAIVTRDILDDTVYKKGAFGISFSRGDLETCKRYCYGGHIVVRTYREVLAWFIRFKWVKKYPVWEKSHRYCYPKYIQLGHFRIEWGKDYTDGYERKIVYQKQD